MSLENDDLDVGSYLFPDDELHTRSNEQLHTLIRDALPIAVGEDDGESEESPWPNPNSEVECDMAQDRIHQARDILLSRGYTFTEAERQALRFLDWHPTAEEAERNARAAAREELEKQRRLRYPLRPFPRAAICS